MATCDIISQFSVKYKHNLKIAHVNAQSLVNHGHFSEFSDIFLLSCVDIIVVSETFLKGNILDSAVALDGYKLFRNDREGASCGGVAVYALEKLSPKLIMKSENIYTGAPKPEYVFLQLSWSNVKILLSCVYRPPKSNITSLETITEDMYNFMFEYDYIFMVGDINGRFGLHGNDSNSITDFLTCFNLSKIDFLPTYHCAGTESNLDLLASNCPDLLVDYGQTPVPGLSGHDLIFAAFAIPVPDCKPKTVTFRDFKSFNYELFMDDALSQPWHNIVLCGTADEKVELFNKMLLDLYDRHAPIKTIQSRRKPAPWMTTDVRKMLQIRDRAHGKYIKALKSNKTEEVRRLWEEFKVHRNKAKQCMRNAKLRHMHSILNVKKSPKAMWNEIKKLGVMKGNEQTHDLLVSVNQLNTYYASVSTTTNETKIVEAIKYYDEQAVTCNDKFYFKYVLQSDIRKCIFSVVSQAKGHDQISVTLLKKCVCVLLPVLEHIYNFCLQNSAFPREWKLAIIKPIPKTKNPDSCKDYRPVSILSVLGKILEKLVHKQLCDYLDSNGLFDTHQSGFRKNHSTTTAILKVTDDVRKAMDKREFTIMVLFDFSKAFDKVQHSLLLAKLKLLGFSDSVLMFLKSYLDDRLQCVSNGKGEFSEWLPLKTGVPQGSVLGPLLYCLYVNDICCLFKTLINGVKLSYHLYADDLAVYITCSFVDLSRSLIAMNSVINELLLFSERHNLGLNADKTQLILLAYIKLLNKINFDSLPSIKINDKVLSYSQSVKYLGVDINQTLTWNQQVDGVIRKVVSSLHSIRRNCYMLPITIKKRLITSLVFPHFDYGSLVYNDLFETLNIRLQRLQNACVRFVLNVPRQMHITPFYVHLKWLKLKERRLLLYLNLIRKILKTGSPMYLRSSFTFMSEVHNRQNRFTLSHAQVPKHVTEKYANSFTVLACKLYNKYKLHTQVSKSDAMFKRDITSDLLCNYK
jgi:hypothetical protein